MIYHSSKGLQEIIMSVKSQKKIFPDFNNFLMMLKVAAPITGTRTVSIANALISTVVLARVDDIALAAGAFITTSQLLISGSLLSIFIPLSVLVSKAKGKGENDKISDYIHSSFYLSFFISLFIYIACKNISFILKIFDQPLEIISLLDKYFDLFVWCIPALVLSQIFTQLAYGLLRQKYVFVINTISTILFAIFSYMLVLGKWGAPSLHIKGLAVACIIKFWFSLVALVIYCYLTDLKPYLRKCFNSLKVNTVLLKELIYSGWPLVLQVLIDIFNSFVILMFSGYMGILAILVVQLANQIYLAISIPIYATSQACSILIAQSQGREEYKNLHAIFNATLWLLLIIISLTLSILFYNLDFCLKIFIDNIETINSLRSEFFNTIIWVGFCLILDTFIGSLSGALRGILDIKIPVIAYLASNWVIAMPLSYIYGVYFQYGPSAIFAAKAIGYIVTTFFLMYRWQTKSKLFFLMQ